MDIHMPSEWEDGSLPVISLVFGQKWKYIAPVRRFVQNCLEVALDDGMLAEDISMAINELLENALKYSDKNEFSLRLFAGAKGDSLTCLVRNQASPGNVAALGEILGLIASRSSEEGYEYMVNRSVSLGSDESQLGLARIHYELNAAIDHVYKEGVLHVRAVFPTARGR